MPIGKVKWYDADKGFGFVTNPGSEDVYVSSQFLPDDIDELFPGQRVEYEFATGRKGPQVMKITDVTGNDNQYQHKYTPEQLQSMVQDTTTMLENNILPVLAQGRRPDRKEARQVAEILRTIARELEH